MLIIVSTYSFDLMIMFLKPALTVNTYRHSYRLSLYVTLATLGPNTGACISVKNMVKKPEKPKFKVFEPKVRRNETPQIAFHCVNDGFRMSAYGARFK